MAREKPTGPRHDLNKENEETLTTEPRVDPVLDAARQVAKKQKNDPHHHGHSPYKRDCLLPTKAAAWAFIAAFQAVMAGLSLPMHVTGYFLPTVIETILLWVTCGLFLIAGILSTVSFFSVMEVAIANDYRAERHDATPAKGEKKLAVVHSIIPLVTVLAVGASLGLFFFALFPNSEETWSEYCLASSVLIVSAAKSKEEGKKLLCEEMYLNQRFLVVGGAVLLLILELCRYFSTRSFIKNLYAEVENPVSGHLASMAKRRARREARRSGRHRQKRIELSSSGSDSGDHDEKALLRV